MTKLELKEKVMGLKDELRTLIENGESEKRELNETETGRIAEIRSEIDSTEAQITEMENEERRIAENNNKETNNNTIKKETRNMVKLFDLVKGIANNTLTDEQRQYVNGNKIDYRAIIQAQGEATTGVETIAEEKTPLEVAIRNASVLNRIGCTWYSGINGDISIPKYSGSQVGWKGEVATADNGEGEFSEVNLKPKRLTAVVRISKTFLAQNSASVEATLIRDLSEALAEELDKTVFGTTSGTTDRPAGLFVDGAEYLTTGGTLADMTYDDVLALELGVEEHNGTDFTFIANPNVKYQLKSEQIASGLRMVWDNNEIDGYKAVVSNSVAKGGVIAMNPRDLVVAMWNNGEILVDPFSLAQDNQIRLVANFYVDAALKGDRIAAAIFE